MSPSVAQLVKGKTWGGSNSIATCEGRTAGRIQQHQAASGRISASRIDGWNLQQRKLLREERRVSPSAAGLVKGGSYVVTVSITTCKEMTVGRIQHHQAALGRITSIEDRRVESSAARIAKGGAVGVTVSSATCKGTSVGRIKQHLHLRREDCWTDPT